MNLEELKKLATGIIEAGYTEGKSEDDIKMDMFAEKIPFSKLNSLYKSISIDLGLMVDPKEVTAGVTELVEQVDFEDMDSWSDVQTVIDGITENVNGATPQRVLSLIRTYCREEEVELPKKPKASSGGGGRARGGKVAVAMTELFAANDNPTKQDFYDVVRPLVKGHRNAMDYMNMFYYILSAVKQGESDLGPVLEKLRSQEDPKNLDADVAEDVESSDDFEEEVA